MNLYERQIEHELNRWHDDIFKKAGVLERAAKGLQTKTQAIVPRGIQNAITTAVKKTVHTVMFGSGILTVKGDIYGLSLAERDYLVLTQFQKYKNTAIVEGIGFGAGGILLGMADLPVLMSIKIKFLFDSAKLYGYDTDAPSERLFMLNVFQLAFSATEHRQVVFRALERWDGHTQNPVDWEKFQIEYRDYLDIAKMLQLLPIIGSVVGGAANSELMNQLRVNVMNCYRMRITGRSWD